MIICLICIIKVEKMVFVTLDTILKQVGLFCINIFFTKLEMAFKNKHSSDFLLKILEHLKYLLYLRLYMSSKYMLHCFNCPD